jgi:hypothetical protein
MDSPHDPRVVRSHDECLRMVEAVAAGYGFECGWQMCLEAVLPPLPRPLSVEGRGYGNCLAFLVDDELGPHFVFDEGEGLEEVLLGEVPFREPLTPVARLWLDTYDRWRCERTHQRRRPRRRQLPSAPPTPEP